MKYMLTVNEEDIANEWQKYLGYTIRPLPNTVAYYENWIDQFKHENRFLLYGATPEIRSLFQKFNLPLTLVDRDEQMVRAMGRLTSSRTPIADKEHYCSMNWLEIDKLNEKFSILLGDDAINMVAWKDFNRFLKNAYQLLEKNGIFICHLLLKPSDNLIDKNFFELLDEYKDNQIKSNYDLASRLNFICFDRADYSMSWQQTINKIGINRLNCFLPHFDFIKQFGLCNSKFYCPPKGEFEVLAKKYFNIEEIFYPSEHAYCLFEPIYVLKKI